MSLGQVEVTNKQVSLSSIVSRNEKITTENIDDALVVLDGTGRVFGLEAVAVKIWSMLAQPKSVRDICDSLAAGHQVQTDQCESDVLEFLSELRAEGLIQVD